MRYVNYLIFFMAVAMLLFGSETTAKTLKIAGTGDSQAILRILARDYGKSNPGEKILIPESVGSGGGIKLLIAGKTDLARTARPLKDKEKAGLIEHLFATSPVVFAANPISRAIDNLSRGQIEALYSGRIVNWQDLDSKNNQRIYLLQREPGDSSRKMVSREIPTLANKSLLAKVIFSTPETAASLRDIPWTLGYLPLSMALSNGLKVLTYQGVGPTAKSYPMNTPFYLISRGRPKGLAARFLTFVQGKKAAAIMAENGVIARR